jgi:hypothetical protein
MRRFMPLAAGLGLLLVATSALASGVRQGTNRRTDLTGDQARTQRVESTDASLSTTRESRLDAGLLAPVEAPRQPVTGPPGLHDLEWPASPVDVQDIRESVSRRAERHANHVADVVLITDDPSYRAMLEQGRRVPRALVAHGVGEAGAEVIFTASR